MRTWSELSGSATSTWVKASAQSELMGPSSAGFALAACIYWERPPVACVAIDVRIPFHSITTTDSVESFSGGLAKSPSQMLNPPTSLPKDAGGCV